MKNFRPAASLILSLIPLIHGGCGGSNATNSPAATATSEVTSKEQAQLAAALAEDERKLSELESRYKATSNEKAAEPVADKSRLNDGISKQKAKIEAQRKRLAELN